MASKKNKADVEETAIVQAAPACLPGLELSNTGSTGYGADHMAHAAKVTAEELIIPTLRIVQDSSKVYTERNEDSDVEIGDIYSTASGKVWKGKDGVLVVPLMCSSCVIKRTPSPEGKYLEKLSIDDPEVVECRARNGGDWARLENKKRETLNYTDEVVCSLIDPGDGVTPTGLVVVSFHGTNVWSRKQWWNFMAEVPGEEDPATGRIYGNPWYAFRTLLCTEIRHGKSKDSYKYKADAYGGCWGARKKLGCRFPPGHPNLDAFKGLLDEYLSGSHGTTSYQDTDARLSESEVEAAAF